MTRLGSDDVNPTVLRFKRTLSEAFPDERAAVIEIGRRPPLWRARRWLISFIRRVQK